MQLLPPLRRLLPRRVPKDGLGAHRAVLHLPLPDLRQVRPLGGFFVAYAEFSGGIFVDCAIHDVDLALWFFGQDSQVKSVVSSGVTAVQPELRKHRDREIPAHYYGRFEQAFVIEANEFTACVLDDLKLPMKLTDAVQAVKIGCALQESLNSGKKIYFDEVGRRVEKAILWKNFVAVYNLRRDQLELNQKVHA